MKDWNEEHAKIEYVEDMRDLYNDFWFETACRIVRVEQEERRI